MAPLPTNADCCLPGSTVPYRRMNAGTDASIHATYSIPHALAAPAGGIAHRADSDTARTLTVVGMLWRWRYCNHTARLLTICLPPTIPFSLAIARSAVTTRCIYTTWFLHCTRYRRLWLLHCLRLLDRTWLTATCLYRLASSSAFYHQDLADTFLYA